MDIIEKPSFRRQVLVEASDFSQELVLLQPEVFGRVLYLQEFLRYRNVWNPLNVSPRNMNGVDAWLFKDKLDEPYVRRLANGEISVCDVTRSKNSTSNRSSSCSITVFGTISGFIMI
eukprot:IDg7211t1